MLKLKIKLMTRIITACAALGAGLVLLFPAVASAGTLFFQPAVEVANQATKYTTTLVLNTEGDSINAIEGSLLIDKSLLKTNSSDNGSLVELTDSGSIITYWVQRPVFDPASGLVKFSGTIPGGYSGGSGILFSLVLPPRQGSAIDNAITITNLKAYKNDGLASSAAMLSKSFALGDVAGEVDPSIEQQLYITGQRKDDIPPEVFSPQLSRDDQVFDGKWFVNFATVDKQSGIDHYEVQESRSGQIDSSKWQVATSPHVLQDQELHSHIYVLAIDRQGNERVIRVFPRKPLPWFGQYKSDLIIIGVVIILIMGGLELNRRRRKKAQLSALHEHPEASRANKLK